MNVKIMIAGLAGTLAILASRAGLATPPPPPPMGVLRGPAALCATHYGFRLAEGEQARQYMAEYWVVSAPGLEMGIRSDLPGLEGPKDRVTNAGLGPGERQRVREYPGNAYRGWVYAFPLREGTSLRIASDQFAGTDADLPLLRRVLVGAPRDALCRSSG
jgi:hypothetical protein